MTAPRPRPACVQLTLPPDADTAAAVPVLAGAGAEGVRGGSVQRGPLLQGAALSRAHRLCVRSRRTQLGYGCTADLVQAAYWFGNSAEQKFARAEAQLGLCYDSGHGVAQVLCSCTALRLSRRSRSIGTRIAGHWPCFFALRACREAGTRRVHVQHRAVSGAGARHRGGPHCGAYMACAHAARCGTITRSATAQVHKGGGRQRRRCASTHVHGRAVTRTADMRMCCACCWLCLTRRAGGGRRAHGGGLVCAPLAPRSV